MSPYAFHPEAFADLADIWEFLAEDNIDAADLVVGEIFEAVRSLISFRIGATVAQTLPPIPYALSWSGTI